MTGTYLIPKFAIVLPILVSKNALINFIRPSEKKIFNIYDKVETKLLLDYD